MMERRGFFGRLAAAACGTFCLTAKADAAPAPGAEECRRTKGGYWRLPHSMTSREYAVHVDALCGSNYPYLREHCQLNCEFQLPGGNMLLDGAFAALTYPRPQDFFHCHRGLLSWQCDRVDIAVLLWHGPPLSCFDIRTDECPFSFDGGRKPPSPQSEAFDSWRYGVVVAQRQLLRLQPPHVREYVALFEANAHGYKTIDEMIFQTVQRRVEYKIFTKTPTMDEEIARVRKELLLDVDDA